MGTTGTAIGVAGMAPIRDRRSESDLFGRELKATLVAVADESVFAQTKRRRRRLWPEVEFVPQKAITDFDTYVLMGLKLLET
jgi:hypothetical protein